MDRAEALARVEEIPSAHLGTVRPDWRPHVVVVTFAIVGESVVTAIDHKPKTTLRLQRLVNIEHQPAATLLVDHYEDDWARLWWVRIEGNAVVIADQTLRDQAISALRGKYAPYRDHPPEGPVIALSIDRVTGWIGDD